MSNDLQNNHSPNKSENPVIEYVPASKAGSFMDRYGKQIFAVVIALIILVAVIVLASALKGCSAAPADDDTVTTVTETLHFSFSDVGKLVTQTFYTTHYLDKSDAKKILGFIDVGKEYLILGEYEISAGYDFAEINVSVDEVLKTITVKMPQPEIISTEYQTGSFRCINDDDNIFNRWTEEEKEAARDELQEAAVANAIEHGIFERAEENAVVLIREFILNTPGAVDYTIQFR